MQQQQRFEVTHRSATVEHASRLQAASDALVAEMHNDGWEVSGTPAPFAGGCAMTFEFIRPYGEKRHA